MIRALRTLAGFGLSLFLLFATLPARAETDAAAATRLRAEALKTYAAADYGHYRDLLLRLDELHPNHPDIAIRRAAAEARAGQPTEALATLNAIADMGASVDLEADPRNAGDFASLAALPAFAAWKARNAANNEPKLSSTPLHMMQDAGLLTEDLALDSKTGDYYVSSVLQHTVLRIAPDGSEQRLPLAAPERGWNILGLAVDSPRRRLWLSAQAIRGFPGITATDAGHAQLSVYDLDSRRRISTWSFRPHGKLQASIGDIALAPNGDLLVSDSEQGVITRVDAGLRKIAVLARGFESPQDIAFTADGRQAFVADYSHGIAVLDTSKGTHHWLKAPRGIALIGIDGLYAWGHDLIAVQNGVRPARIVRLSLDDALNTVTGFEILDRDPAALGEPTHGVIDSEGTFTYLANVGWNHLGEDGKVRDGEVMTPAVLRRLRLR